jgi:hypothetical protein
MPDNKQVVIHVIVRDGLNGELLTVRRLDRETYVPPFGHDVAAIRRAVLHNADKRYSYFGAVVQGPVGEE